mmetsp:Transcript_16881/g.42924  ORF Transcript_16881/g.42924 Transcript_16881/m.42924 type:complete len:284 (-) Transcript_16881:601-1452(-)
MVLRSCGVCDGRVVAFTWESVVQPLGEETAVQRDTATVRLRDVVQLLHKRQRKGAPRRLVCGHYADDNTDNLVRPRVGQRELCLQLAQDRLTLVHATSCEEPRRCHAIGVASHVVRHNNARVLRVRLIQHAIFTKILLALRELPPASMQSTVPEARQRHPTGAITVLQVHQYLLQVAALCILPYPILLAHLRNDLLHIFEGVSKLLRAVGLHRCRFLLEPMLFHLAHPIHGLWPSWVHLCHVVRPQLLYHPRGHGLGVSRAKHHTAHQGFQCSANLFVSRVAV